MKTRYWETLEVFEEPIFARNIKFKESPLSTPNGVEEIIRKNWNEQLKEKQAQIAKVGIQAEIHNYHLDKSNNPLNALYEKGKPIMWPGPAISLSGIRKINNSTELIVGQTSFPYISALKNKEVSHLYEIQGIVKPRPALGITTFALTADENLVLTVRGSRTNMYPGRLSGQGGNPTSTDTDITIHQIDEMKEEINLDPEHYDPNNLRINGIAIDNEQLMHKTDLVGWIPINLEAKKVREMVYQRNPNERPNDVIGVVFISGTEGGLFKDLIERSHPVQYCPLAHGGLVLYGYHSFGKEWAKDLLDKLKDY